MLQTVRKKLKCSDRGVPLRNCSKVQRIDQRLLPVSSDLPSYLSDTSPEGSRRQWVSTARPSCSEPNQPPFDLMVDRNDYHQREFVDERLFLVSPNLVRIVNVLSSSQSGESPSLFPSDCCDDFGDALYVHGQCYT